MQWLREPATVVEDPDAPAPVQSDDPGDDYLIALAASRQAVLVSGDRHLLDFADRIPVLSPALFRERLADQDTETSN